LRRFLITLFAVGAVWVLPQTVTADRTQLLKVDLRTGKRSAIDKGAARKGADAELDALLDKSTGKTFSTKDLANIEKAVRRYLRATRPRAEPRLLLFLYPGSITSARLKELREVLIDIDLIVDPCGRTVCKGSVAKHLEILGKSIKKAVIQTSDYRIRFKSVTVRTATHMGGTQFDIYSFQAAEVVQAGKQGGGIKLVTRVARARSGYGRKMSKLTARKLKLRRVRLSKTPSVRREAGKVSVEIEIRSDRVRVKGHVLDALIGAMHALKTSKLTPTSVSFQVVALVPHRGTKRRLFRCQGSALREYLAGKLDKSTLWSSFVLEQKKGGTHMSFSDADTRPGGGADRGPDRTPQILAENFRLLAPCLSAEASRNSRFRGLTVQFSVSGKGRAIKIRTKERASGRVKQCLKRVLRGIAFQRHGGSPRAISYPMYIKR
jgi:hypothetical protein